MKSIELTRKRYCGHTSPRSFKAMHFENSEETETEICGKKVTNKFLSFVADAIGQTIYLVVIFIDPIFKLFGTSLIHEVKNDLRCDNCKKEI